MRFELIMYKTFGSADVMLGSNAIYEKTRDVKRYKRKKKNKSTMLPAQWPFMTREQNKI